ncbi:MAG: HAD-IC family P-type ATPase [Candidatus Gracilibacteria bacterium]
MVTNAQPRIPVFHIIAREIGPILFRNLFSLITLIVAVVVTILLLFGELREGLFLGSALTINILVGIVQEIRAKIALEKLQALTAQKVHRVNADGSIETIALNDVKVGDILKLITGDQVPADGKITESKAIEVNEALLTGESDNIPKYEGEGVFAGSIVVAGHALMMAETTPKESFVVKMTDKVKKYSINLSPIQRSIVKFIRIMSVILLIVVAIILVRGRIAQEELISMVKEIAALTGALVPEGLILAITLLFTYGAVRLFRGQLLLQEINSTEGLGRIYNLCIDKTGTLTENEPTVDQLIPYNEKEREELVSLTCHHLRSSEDTSSTGTALKNFLSYDQKQKTKVLETLPFSSERKYAASKIQTTDDAVVVTVGAPDILITFIKNEVQKKWIEDMIDLYASQAKRLVLICKSKNIIRTREKPEDELQVLGLFVLSNPLRPGTKDIIDFFQKRGVQIRVISGDNAKTVQAIAQQCGIEQSDKVATGSEIEKWKRKDFSVMAHKYHLFARVRPEQKEKLVKAFKKSGFTAMVGDGANDALAIKKADLGIAMFDGASATRQIAKIVLMNNSFALLPTGVKLADSIISTIEMVGSIFFNKVTASLALFVIIGLLGVGFPIGPRNMTIINYCIIGFPVFYWAAFPADQERSIEDRHFLKKVMPMAAINGLLTALACVAVFIATKGYMHPGDHNTSVVFTFAMLGYWFFLNVPNSLNIKTTLKQRRIAYGLGVVEVLLFMIILQVPVLSEFFDLQMPNIYSILMTLSIIGLTGSLQYIILTVLFKEKYLNKLRRIFSLE